MLQRVEEFLDVTVGALNFDRHAGRGIEDVAGQSQLVRQVVNERTEPDTLHDAAHPYLLAG